MKTKQRYTALILVSCLIVHTPLKASAASYHIDSIAGDDANDGLSPQKPWKTLRQASGSEYNPGDRIALKRGSEFKGKLLLTSLMGSKKEPVIIEAYGSTKAMPKINSAGYIGGVVLDGCEYVDVRDLEIVSDGGTEIDPAAKTDRNGILVSNSSHVSVSNLNVHSIFATIQTKSEGKDNTTAYGHGIRLMDSSDLTVADCVIEKTGRYGIQATRSRNIEVLGNDTDHTGCSGIQMSRCKEVLIRENTFNHPGSFIDERMHGRGSGSWAWSCEDVLYEKNRFLNAKGKADSCGVHIDFNCSNVVVQYCFSMNNAGGFIEILGNDYNCAYRYNISVNDGFRKKGKDGAHQEGKVLWLSGYCGSRKPRSGPFNSYIYNNTVYVKDGARSCFSVSPTAKGILIANNIFHLSGITADVKGDQKRSNRKDKTVRSSKAVFENNVYLSDSILPSSLRIQDSSPIVGDARFKNPGGSKPEDYIPANTGLLKDKGIAIRNIPGDETGLTIGLKVTKDFFGKPISGLPDIGAIEIDESTNAR